MKFESEKAFNLLLRPFIHGEKDQHKSCTAHHGEPLLCPCLRTTCNFFLVIFLGWVMLLHPQATSTDHGVVPLLCEPLLCPCLRTTCNFFCYFSGLGNVASPSSNEHGSTSTQLVHSCWLFDESKEMHHLR